jgi:hypothetical protein
MIVLLHFKNKIFSGYQPRQMAEWRKNQRFEDHLHPRPQSTSVLPMVAREDFIIHSHRESSRLYIVTFSLHKHRTASWKGMRELFCDHSLFLGNLAQVEVNK